jgi:hypothetical protein
MSTGIDPQAGAREMRAILHRRSWLRRLWHGAIAAAVAWYVWHLLRKLWAKDWPVWWKIAATTELVVLGICAWLVSLVLLSAWRLATPSKGVAR